MTATRVSVIIPVFGDGPSLHACVLAVLEQSYPMDLTEVIVVDNGSRPPVEARWGEAVWVIVEDLPGSYAARRRGVTEARGQLLCFTDSDCVPDREWLRNGVMSAERHGLDAIIAGRVRLTTSPAPSVAELHDLRYGFPQQGYLAEGFGVTANLFVPRAIYDRVGGFDITLRSGGDREFGERATSAGVPLVFCEDAVVDHPARSTIRQLVRKARRTSGGNVQREVRTTSRWNVAGRSLVLLRPPVRGIIRILRDGGPLRARLGLSGLVVLLRWVVLAERLRVVATRRPVR